MKRTSNSPGEAVARQYAKVYRHKCEEAAEYVRRILADALEKKGIKCASSARAKNAKSLAGKLRKLRGNSLSLSHLVPFIGTEGDKNRIKDLAGVRISLYFPSDWALVEAEIFERFKNVTAKELPEPDEKRPSRKRFEGYSARHYQIDSRHGLRAELQVASALTHAWMEVDHDLVYKPREKVLDASELAMLDGLHGMVMAGEVILDGLKIRLLQRRVVKARKNDRLRVPLTALRSSKSEFIAIGQNLFSLLAGEGARNFQDELIRCLMREKKLKVTIVVADPDNKRQTSDLSYGFPSFDRQLRKSVAALKVLHSKAAKVGVIERLNLGTSRMVNTTSTVLTDPARANGVAYVTYTQLGSNTKDRAVVKIERRKHPASFAELREGYVRQCEKGLAPLPLAPDRVNWQQVNLPRMTAIGRTRHS